MELMTVLLIIGMLGAVATVSFRKARAHGRKTTAEMEIGNIVNGLEMFNSLTARYPSQDEGLEILLKPLEGDVNGILKNKHALDDPWGIPYMYIVTNDKREPFEVLSAGPDKREGTPDDISNLISGNAN